MKILLLNFLALLVFASSLAQGKGIINYKLTTKNYIGNNEINKIIYFYGHQSIEFFVPRKVLPSSEQKSENEYLETRVVKTKKQSFILKDLEAKKLVLSDNIFVTDYLINDTLNNFTWNITSDHKRISNYNCTKATLNFRGRDYVAWYAEAIPLAFGPWKFGGLPGLIVKVYDQDEKFVYELTGIDLKTKFNLNLLKIPSEYRDDKFLSHNDFISIYNKKVADYAKMAKVVHTYPNGATGSGTVILPEKQEKF